MKSNSDADFPKTHTVLIHGMGLRPFWMARIARHLRRAGHVVHNIGYPATREPIERLMEEHLKPAIDSLPPDVERLNFVTHSLGSIILRLYHKKYTPPAQGRTVMIGPPNQGSEVAQFLKPFPPYKWVFGYAGQSLGTTPDDTPNKIGPANFEVGIIAGSLHWIHLLTGPFLPKPNDGLVTVARSKLEGMKDHIVINASHSLMPWDMRVIRQIQAFLKNGFFDREKLLIH